MSHLPLQLHWSLEYWERAIRHRSTADSKYAMNRERMFVPPLSTSPPARYYIALRSRYGIKQSSVRIFFTTWCFSSVSFHFLARNLLKKRNKRRKSETRVGSLTPCRALSSSDQQRSPRVKSWGIRTEPLAELRRARMRRWRQRFTPLEERSSRVQWAAPLGFLCASPPADWLRTHAQKSSRRRNLAD